jgi:hypothetical protein
MSAATSELPRASTPKVVVTPPSPTITSVLLPTLDTILHASTSSLRVLSPIIFIPGHEPLTTTLTPQELFELLPTLRTYIEPAYPSVAILPSVGISYTGLQMALLWREADLYGSTGELESDLSELIQIYQALAYLGNKATSRALWSLNKMILSEINEGLTLGEYQELWALHSLPFTEPFIKAIVKRLALLEMTVADIMDRLDSQWLQDRDDEFAHMFETAVCTLRWVNKERSLKKKIEHMRSKLDWEARKVARMQKRGGISALKEFKMQLETVSE